LFFLGAKIARHQKRLDVPWIEMGVQNENSLKRREKTFKGF
jgi:hypothetical protein